MNIDGVIAIAQAIHDAEHWNLGSASSRETRNAFWARAIGCVHWGHPVYNKVNADPRWGIKSTTEGGLQSDDVTAILRADATSAYLPRDAWDCIPGCGADGYSFAATYLGQLPGTQHIYAPPRPASVGQPTPPPTTNYPDENTWWKAYEARVAACYAEAGLKFPDNPAAFRWFSRCGFDIGMGMIPDNAAKKHIEQLRDQLGLPPVDWVPLPGM